MQASRGAERRIAYSTHKMPELWLSTTFPQPNARGRLQKLVKDDAPFWRTKTLEEMSTAEWESLCDGCGRCCMIKLEDEDTGEVHFTRLSCHMLDAGSCRCSDYENRFE